MGKEIERKFIVESDAYKELSKGVLYRQGYLSSDMKRTVRVRICDNRGYITIKGKSQGATRPEYEYESPVDDAQEMLEDLCKKPIIEKLRYKYSFEGFVWEIDEFLGDNLGLVIAEIELPDENTKFNRPHWIGKEVTGMPEYFNSNLVHNPYKNWKP
jgi:adenylate cyclase